MQQGEFSRKIESICKTCWLWNLGPVHTYPDSFVSANILLRIQKFTRPHVYGFVAFSSVHTYPRKRYEYARFAYKACAITCDEPAMLLLIAWHVYFVVTYIERLETSETTIWLTKPDHQAFVRPSLTKNLRGRAWRLLLTRFTATFLATGIDRSRTKAARILS